MVYTLQIIANWLAAGLSTKRPRRQMHGRRASSFSTPIEAAISLESRALLTSTNGVPASPEILEDTATGLLAEYDPALHRLTITGTSETDFFIFEVRDNQMILRDIGNWTGYNDQERFLIFASPANELANVQIFLGDGNDSIAIADSLSASVLVEIDAGEGGDSIKGGPGNDTIIGGAGGDYLLGGGGNDLIDGRDGDDMLNGEEGNDTLWGADGDDGFVWDRLSYRSNPRIPQIVKNGEDIVFAGEGTDALGFSTLTTGITLDLGSTLVQPIGTADDPGASIQFGSGNDIENVFGPIQGDNVLIGNALDNQLYGGNGNDTLIGKEGDDFLFGFNGNDQLDGREGDDKLNGLRGHDILIGDSGNDTFDFGWNAVPAFNADYPDADTDGLFYYDLTNSPQEYRDSYRTNEGEDVVIDVEGITRIKLQGKAAVIVTTPAPGQPVRRMSDRLGFSLNIVSGSLGQQFELSSVEVNF